MDSVSYLMSGFATAISGWNLLYCLIGVTIGMLVGVLPGLGPSAGTAVLIPLTFGMEPISAIVMLSGIYYGAMYGGTITSVLINTPGEAASVVTAFDGYPMTKQGRAGAALGTAVNKERHRVFLAFLVIDRLDDPGRPDAAGDRLRRRFR